MRRRLFAAGFRYRVDHPLPFDRRRRADLLFIGPKVAVFVDGCFWHGCPRHGTTPKSNTGWWLDKIETNRRRDRDTNARLREIGWIPVRVWEHEDPARAVRRIADALDRRTTGRG